MEIKNNEWRQHLISSWHLELNGEKYCDICKKIYNTIFIGEISSGFERIYLESASHNKHQERLVFYLNYIFIYLFYN